MTDQRSQNELWPPDKDSVMHYPLSINEAHHCPLMRHTTIKEKVTKVKHTYKYSTKSLSTHFLSKIFLPYWLKHQRRFGWHHTSILLFHLVHFASFSSIETTPFAASSIHYDEELNCWFFVSSNYVPFNLVWPRAPSNGSLSMMIKS